MAETCSATAAGCGTNFVLTAVAVVCNGLSFVLSGVATSGSVKRVPFISDSAIAPLHVVFATRKNVTTNKTRCL